MAKPRINGSATMFARRRAALKAGMCIWCRKNEHLPDKTRCKDCILADRLRKRPGGVWRKGKRGRPHEV